MDSGRRFLFDGACNGNMFSLGNNGDSGFRGSRGSLLNLNLEDTSTKKRAFFSYADEYIEEEFYDEQMPEKKRRLTAEQVHLLEKSFAAENKLEPERKTDLAKKLGLQPRQVAIWFQNRRARWKNKQLERDYDILKASYDSLLENYDSIVKENEKFKSEVASLTEKLHKDDLLPADPLASYIGEKGEDRLSSGSGVIDEDSPQLVDSDGSYFHDEDYHMCMPRVDGIHSEEDDGSDDGRSYFSNVFDAVQQQEDTEPSLGWWDWS